MFAYCNNNPVMFADPSGRCLTEITLAFIVEALCLGGISVSLLMIADIASENLSSITVPSITIDIPNIIVYEPDIYGETHRDQLNITFDADTEEELPDVEYPGDDPTVAPGDDYEWRGKPPVGGDKGAWVDKGTTGQQWHPDLNHKEPIGPHWDYKDIFGKWWRIFKNNPPELK